MKEEYLTVVKVSREEPDHLEFQTARMLLYWKDAFKQNFLSSFIYFEREREQEGKGQREGETESQAGSTLPVQTRGGA